MSDQWRGPGWWVADDGLWYPPEAAGPSDSRWSRRSGWIEEIEDEPMPERMGPITAGTSIIEAATGGSASEVEAVIDLRARYRESLRSTDDQPEMELVAATPEPARAATHEVGPADAAPEPAPRPVRPVEPVSVAPPEPLPSAGASKTRPAPTPPVEPVIRDEPDPVPTPAPAARRSRSGPILLLLATALAVTSGVLGALWVRERDVNDELRLELAQIRAADDATSSEITELSDQIRTLEIRNEQLAQQLQEAQSLVAPVPEGRISVIDIPFDPVYVDEVRGQFIAMGGGGEYVIWGSGVDTQITDSGVVEGAPTGMYAARDQAFVSTDAGRVEVLSLMGAEDGMPILTGPVFGLEQDNRQFWAFSAESNELRRYRSTNGRLTTSVALPTGVRELSVGAGAVWALGDDDTIYRVNTADFTVTPVAAGQDVISIAAGPDALWTLSAADGSLRRVDAVSGEVLVTVPVGRDPIDAVFSGNSVWVALRSGATLVEVDTRTSAVVSRTSLPAEPRALSPGETGVLVVLDAEDPLIRVATD